MIPNKIRKENLTTTNFVFLFYQISIIIPNKIETYQRKRLNFIDFIKSVKIIHFMCLFFAKFTF